MAIEPETYKVSVTLDEELYRDLDKMIEERGMSRSSAMRLAMRIGFDHYKECKALGIMAVSDIILEAREMWNEKKKAQKI